MKNYLIIMSCLVTYFLFSSCNQQQRQERIENCAKLLMTVPVYYDQDTIQQQISYEEGKFVIAFAQNDSIPDWAYEAVGTRWAPGYFLKQIFNGEMSSFLLQKALLIDNDESPLHFFMGLLEHENSSIIMKFGDFTYDLTTEEVVRLLIDESNDEEGKNLIAVLAIHQLKDFGEVIDEPFIGSVKIVDAGNDEQTVYIDINLKEWLNKPKVREALEGELTSFNTIPIYCYQNGKKLAVRYHIVGNNEDISKNTSDIISTVIDYIPANTLERKWREYKKMLESRQ